VPTALPQSAAQPASVTPAEGVAVSNPYLSKDDHLRIAIDHLEAAARNEEAQRVRRMEAKDRPLPESGFIRVDLRMIEFSLTKLAKVDSAPYGGTKGMSVLDLLVKLQATGKPTEDVNVLPSPDPKLIALVEALLKDHLAWPRSEPSLLVTSGRPACVHVGGEVGYRVKDAGGKEVVEYKEYGTRADALATLLPGNRIHLDARLRVSELDPAYSAGEDGIPSIKSREVETGLELHSGQTVAITGLVEERTEAYLAQKDGPGGNPGSSDGAKEIRQAVNRVEMVVLLRAEIVTDKEMKKDKTAE